MNEKLEQLLATLSEEFQKALYSDLDTRITAIADFPKTLDAIRQLVSGQKPQATSQSLPHPRPPIRPTKLGREVL